MQAHSATSARLPAAASPRAAVRRIGRYALRRLLGKSERTMLWLAAEPAGGHEVMLTMPRIAPAGAAALARWVSGAQRAARLDHPNLARVLEVGVHENWPFIAVERSVGVPLDEWLQAHLPASSDEVAGWICGALRGLSFAHDGGVAHLDLQLRSLLVDERGQVSVMAFGATAAAASGAADASSEVAQSLDPAQLRARRLAAERDIVAVGILLHQLLAGEPALGVADTARVVASMAPNGPELVRLPWTLRWPVNDALRAIVNRSTAGQPRLRYRNARTMLDALEGWRAAGASDDAGPVALLLERVRRVGHLPAAPGLTMRVQGVRRLEAQRTDDIARQILPDVALSFELLRMLNSAQLQGTHLNAGGPVLTLSRAVALIGVDGVEQAADGLRPWPGALDDASAQALAALLERVRLAGYAAQALRPPGYDPEAAYLVAVLQNLGRLMLRYHFAEPAEQIQQLLQSARAPAALPEGAVAEPALGEEAATFTVLGVDLGVLGAAVARHWGFDAELQHMIRRLPPGARARKPASDGDVLRIVGSAANDIVDALSEVPSDRFVTALSAIAARYARALEVDGRGLADALRSARERLRDDGPVVTD
jgi:eukaryotic-like serine/threonine-protein kinase